MTSSPVDDICRTLSLYCQLCDDGRFDEFAQLFAPDATFRVMGREYVGRDAIKGFMAAAQGPESRGKHITSNVVITVDGATAQAFTDYLFVGRVSGSGGPGSEFAITSVGRYHDELAHADDGSWLFTSREIVFLGDAPSRTLDS